MSTRALLVLAALHVLAGALFLRDAGPGFPLDDAWVHMVYARSLATGEGFAYNPGAQELGMSAPLWTVLCALPAGLAHLLETRPDPFVRLLCGVAGLFAAWAGWRLAARAGRWPAVFAALVLTFDPLWLFTRFSGMEVALFGGVVLLLIEAVLDDRPARAGVLTGLATLLRPEGLVLGAVALAMLVRQRARPWRFVAPVLLCVGPWIAFCLVVGGRPYPNTAVHKAQPVGDPGAIADAVGALFAGTGWGWALVLALAAGVVALEGGYRRLGRSLLGFAAVLLAAVLLSREMPVSEDRIAFYWERYALIAWPLLLVVAAAGLASIVRTAYAGLFCRLRAAILLILPLALIAWTGRGLPARAEELRTGFGEQCRDVEDLNVAAGLWIDENLPADALVATHDAGAIRFFGRRRTIDIWGNNSVELTNLMRAGGDAAARWIVARGIDALVVFPAIYAIGHSPEYAAWVRVYGRSPGPSEDWAAALGLTRRVATFEVERSVYGERQETLAVFVRP